MFIVSLSSLTYASTFVVNSNADTVDAIPGDGICLDSFGNCTLRAAIQTANELPNSDIINFSLPAPITLTLTQGPLYISGSLVISAPTSTNVTVNFSNVYGSKFAITEGNAVVTFN